MSLGWLVSRPLQCFHAEYGDHTKEQWVFDDVVKLSQQKEADKVELRAFLYRFHFCYCNEKVDRCFRCSRNRFLGFPSSAGVNFFTFLSKKTKCEDGCLHEKSLLCSLWRRRCTFMFPIILANRKTRRKVWHNEIQSQKPITECRTFRWQVFISYHKKRQRPPPTTKKGEKGMALGALSQCVRKICKQKI